MSDENNTYGVETFPDLEVLDLRRKNRALQELVAKYEAVLEENDLMDEISPDAEAKKTDQEEICERELGRLNEISKRAPLMPEDVKVVETLVKTLLAIRAKHVPSDDDSKKKKPKKNAPTTADLLSIVNGKK